MDVRKLGLIIFIFSLVSCKPGSKTCDTCSDSHVETGQSLYFDQCISCHGEDGKLGNSGAADLSKSELTDKEIRYILSEGQGAMPPMLELVEEPKYMDSVVSHIKKLRTK